MATFDIIVCIVVILAAIKGFQTGLVLEVFSFAAFFVGLFLALKLTFPISEEYFGDSDAFWIISIIIFLVLLFAVIWVAKVFATSIKKILDFTPAGILDNLLGSLFSIIKWLFLFSTVLWVMESTDLGFPKRWLEESRLYEVVSRFAPVIVDVVSYYIPWFQDVMDSMERIKMRF